MKNIFFHNHRPAFHPRINYVLWFIEDHPLAKGQLKFTSDAVGSDITIHYGAPAEEGIFLPAQGLLFAERTPAGETLQAGEYTVDDLKLYSVEQQPGPSKPFFDGNAFAFDLIETIFFHISRYEEWFYKKGNLDAFGRMDEEEQFLVRNGLEKIPVVDHLILAFLRALGLSVNPTPSSFVLTHDIDFIERNNRLPGIIRSILGSVLKRGDLKTARRIWQQRNQPNPYDTFEWMLSADERLEKKIYFLVGGNSRYDNPFDLDHPVFQKAVRLAIERGYQIGIHPSYESWKSAAMIRNEKEKLEQAIENEVHITRQHFLRFSFPETANILEKLGFKEDASLGYAERIGFRCGTGFPYHLYNFEKERPYSFLVLPLVFMDSALFYESNQAPEQFTGIWKEFLLQNAHNTQITFNFHNSRFFDAFLCDLPLEKLYLELLGSDK